MQRSHVEALYVTAHEARNLLSAAQWLTQLQLNGFGAQHSPLGGAIVGQTKLDAICLLLVVNTAADPEPKDLANTDFQLHCTEDLTTVHPVRASNLTNDLLIVESTNVSHTTWGRAVQALQDRQAAAMRSGKRAAALCSQHEVLRTLVKLWSLGTAYQLLQPISQLLNAHDYSMTVLQPLVAQLQQQHAAAAAAAEQPSSTQLGHEALMSLARQLLQDMSSEMLGSLLTLLQTAHTRLLQLPLTAVMLDAAADGMQAQLQHQRRQQQQAFMQQHHSDIKQQAADCNTHTDASDCAPGSDLSRQKQLKRPAPAGADNIEAAAAAADVDLVADGAAKVAPGPSGKKLKAGTGLEKQQSSQPEQHKQHHRQQGLHRADSDTQHRPQQLSNNPHRAMQQQRQRQQDSQLSAPTKRLPPQHPQGPQTPRQQHRQQQPNHEQPSAAAHKLPDVLQRLQQQPDLREHFGRVLVSRMKVLDRPRLSLVEALGRIMTEVPGMAPYVQVPGLLEAYIKQDPDNIFVLVDRVPSASAHRLAGDGQLLEVDPVMCRQLGAKFTPCAQKVDTCSCRFGDSCRFSHLC